MESRKDQLKKQLIEALNSNDNDLYALLKSQWAHRFGVESLEELKNLDLNPIDQNINNDDAQNIDKLEKNSFEDGQAISIKGNNDLSDNEEKQITKDVSKDIENKETYPMDSFEIKSKGIVDNEKYDKKTSVYSSEIKGISQVEKLIPLPPKPKYGFLRKWLLRK